MEPRTYQDIKSGPDHPSQMEKMLPQSSWLTSGGGRLELPTKTSWVSYVEESANSDPNFNLRIYVHIYMHK